MKILGIETSCDETAAAVVEMREDGTCVLHSNVVRSSMDLHAAFGGVVPEIAARSHIEYITPVIKQALQESLGSQESGVRSLEIDPWGSIDGIAVTYGAGLGGSLLIGVLTARTLAIIKKKPLYAINHVEGHIYANFITEVDSPLLSGKQQALSGTHSSGSLTAYRVPRTAPSFPMLGLIVSGGHSQLVLWRDHFDYTLLGQTYDDAVGEAFDKVAKILGLPYPGGPSIEKKAKEGDAFAYQFPKAKITRPPSRHKRSDEVQGGSEDSQGSVQNGTLTAGHSDNAAIRAAVESGKYDFSFSGLKTAVLRAAQAAVGEDYNFPSHLLPDKLSESKKANIAASFQRIALETVVDKTVLAYEEFKPKSVVIGGGVASSPELRRQLEERLPRLSGRQDGQASPIEYTDHKLCTDNGAMIAALGCFHAKLGSKPADPYSLDIRPNLSM